MNKHEIIEHINGINISIIQLKERHDNGAVICAQNDLTYYQNLLSMYS